MFPTRPASVICPLVIFALLAPPLRGQGPTTVELGKRLAKSRYTLGRVVGSHELPDGRVVVGDAKEGVFRIVDLAKGDVTLIGKQGDGPDEYRSAFAILPTRGDSVLLYDLAGRKFLRLAPNGAVAGTMTFANTSTRTRRNGLPAAADTTGALYYTAIDIDTAMKSFPISSGVRRLAAGATTDEELIRVNGRRADQAQANGLMVFPFRDAWAVRADGLVARVMADSYAVSWSRDGKEIGRTGPLAYQPIPITTAEAQLITDSIHAGMKAMSSTGGATMAMSAPPSGAIGAGGSGATVTFGGSAGASGGMVMITRSDGGSAPTTTVIGDKAAAEMSRSAATTFDPSTIPVAPFPATRPAIPSNGTVAIFDANGMLWVARERPRSDASPRYDIISQDRGVVAQVKLPSGTRLLGFGKGVVYLARAEDGSDWLERYAMPKY